ncbi:MAG: hypothetical protein ACLFSW_01820 [Halobacteriales archaeon]
MENEVYRVRASFEVPLDELRDFLDGYGPPAEIDGIDIERRGNKLLLTADADRDASNYTPTALLKASLKERRLYKTEDGWSREDPSKEVFGDEEVETKTVEYACFKGDRETVLQNTALRYPMFRVLADIARFAGVGELTGISVVDGELSATRIVEGEERPATVEVIDPSEDRNETNASGWRDNSLIG